MSKKYRSIGRLVWEVGSDMSGPISVLANIAGTLMAALPNASSRKGPIILLWFTAYLAMWVFVVRLKQRHSKVQGELNKQIGILKNSLDRRDLLERQGLELAGCLERMSKLANEIYNFNYFDFNSEIRGIFNNRTVFEINHTHQQIRIISQPLAAWYKDQIPPSPPLTNFGMVKGTQYRDRQIAMMAVEVKISALKTIIYDFCKTAHCET